MIAPSTPPNRPVDRPRTPGADRGTAGPLLTAEGRGRLAARAHRLREELLPLLRAQLRQFGRDPAVQADYECALAEEHRLVLLLAGCRRLEDRDDDPTVVELGDLVTLSGDDGAVLRFLLVDAAEAGLDDLRLSVAGPLGRAVLGGRIGQRLVVPGDDGGRPVTVLGACRPGPGRLAAVRP